MSEQLRLRDLRDHALPSSTPRMFSFNSPHGACPTCDGLGDARESTRSGSCSEHPATLGEGAIGAVGPGAAAGWLACPAKWR